MWPGERGISREMPRSSLTNRKGGDVEITPETTKVLAALLAGVLSGGGTYEAAKFVFDYLLAETFGVDLAPRTKRVLILPVCLIVVAVALSLEVLLKIAPLTPDAIVIALGAAFTTSQMIHAKDMPA